MPVSTTIFATKCITLQGGYPGIEVMKKSFFGIPSLAFFVLLIVWYAIERWVKHYLKGKQEAILDRPSGDHFSGTLAGIWIMQDAV